MKESIAQSIKSCIDAINHSREGLDLEVLETIRTLASLPYNGAGLGIGTEGYRGYRPSYQEVIKIFIQRKRINNNLDWEKALMLLYDAANLFEEDILLSAENIKDDIIFNHVLEHVISNLAAKNDIANALKFISQFRTTTIFREENNKDSGYLIILRHYAAKADADNFFNYFKFSEPRKNKSELADLKAYLVESFASSHDIEEAIHLCKHKNLGEKFQSSALFAFAKTGKYAELKSTLEKYPELKQLENETELGLLSTAYLAAKKNKLVIEDNFEVLFERALKLDRKIKSGAAAMRDAVLFNLGMAEHENEERRERCRKAIKNNSIKREFNTHNSS
jgi:hypothetical protein